LCWHHQAASLSQPVVDLFLCKEIIGVSFLKYFKISIPKLISQGGNILPVHADQVLDVFLLKVKCLKKWLYLRRDVGKGRFGVWLQSSVKNDRPHIGRAANKAFDVGTSQNTIVAEDMATVGHMECRFFGGGFFQMKQTTIAMDVIHF
jgi:hypothetical protein